MTSEEQSREQRISRVKEFYTLRGIDVSVTDTDNWRELGIRPTSSFHMSKRGMLPVHYSYRIVDQLTGQVTTKELM